MQQPNRLHKKPSFTIINELSPNLSRAPSPITTNSGRTSPFLGRGFKSSRNHLYHRNSFDSIDHRVTFSNSLVSQPRSHSSLALTPRSILQNKTYNNMESYEIETDAKHKTMIKIKSSSSSNLTRRPSQSNIPVMTAAAFSRRSTSLGPRKRSFEMLPFITQIPKSNVMSSRNLKTHQKLFRSKTNLVLDETKETTNSKPPINPRSHHKGIMKVVGSGSPTKIPMRRDSISGSRRGSISADRRDNDAKRTQSISPARRKSSLIPATRRTNSRNSSPNTRNDDDKKYDKKSNSVNLASKKIFGKTNTASKFGPAKKAINAAKIKVTATKNLGSNLSSNAKKPAKKNVLRPPTLSPIAGTPNKDDVPVTPESRRASPKKKKEDTITDATPDSPSKIPVRHPSSQKIDLKQKEASPAKEPGSTPKSPTKSILSFSQKPKFGFSSVSKALTRSFRRKKNNESDSDSVKDSLGSAMSLRKLGESEKQLNTINQENDSPSKDSIASRKSAITKRLETEKQKKESMLKRQISNLSKKITEVDAANKGNTDNDKMTTHTEEDGDESKLEKFEKLVPLTKSNVVSMTTAAITAQPVQISTTVTNQLGQIKEPGDAENESAPPPSSQPTQSILEQSQKTLENVQKTVNTATEEIQKSINENLTNLKTMETKIETEAKAMSDQLISTDNQPPPYKTSTSNTTATTNITPSINSGTTKTSNTPSAATTNGATPKNPSPKKNPAPNPPQSMTSSSTPSGIMPIEASVSVINEKNQKTPTQSSENNNDLKKSYLMMEKEKMSTSSSSGDGTGTKQHKTGSRESDEQRLMSNTTDGSVRDGGGGNSSNAGGTNDDHLFDVDDDEING